MSSAPRKLTYSDYAAIPDDGKRYEVLEGGLLVTPAPSPLHQRVSFRLQRILADYFESRSLGEVFSAPIDVVLSEHDIVQPDLVVVGRPDQISNRAIEGAPLLVVEIFSPSTKRRDKTIKPRRYAALEVPHLWLVDPDAPGIQCLRLDGDLYGLVAKVEGSQPFSHPDWPGLVLSAEDLFR